MNGSRKRQGVAAIVLVLIIIGTAAASAGCGSQANAAADPVRLTEADNGKVITVKAGDTVKVALAGNPTTGYSWASAMTDQDAAVLQQQGDPAYVQESTDESVVGSGGTFTFTFKALASGQATIKLVYVRPWEKDVAPAQTFSASVTVE
jgi:inhibitor of cysteine peptidase